VLVELAFDVGLVEAVVFKLPLVFSFVVLGLELVLVLPYVELGDDEYVESVLCDVLDGDVELLLLAEGEL